MRVYVKGRHIPMAELTWEDMCQNSAFVKTDEDPGVGFPEHIRLAAEAVPREVARLLGYKELKMNETDTIEYLTRDHETSVALIVNRRTRREVWARWKITDYLKMGFLAIMQLVMLILGYPVCAIALAFCHFHSEEMPKWAWAWGNDVDTINGDTGQWQKVIDKSWWLTRRRDYFTRWWWCAVRNPCRNYSMWVGVSPADVREIWINDEYNINRRQCNSLTVLAITEDGKRYTMWMPSWPLGKIRFLGKFGFKLWDMIPLARDGVVEKRQFTFYGWFQKGMKCGG